MKALHIMPWVAALALTYSQAGVATTVYKSIDENGVVSFSDAAPENGVILDEVELTQQDPLPDVDAQQRLKDMRETTDRMAADRMAREKHRAEMRELQAKTEALREPQYDETPDYSDYSTIYTGGGYYNYRPYRPNYRPHHRPGHARPEHPIARPPLRPVGNHSSLNNRFPAPHIRPLFTPRTRGAPH